MASEGMTISPGEHEFAGWTRIAIVAGLLACVVYPLMVYLPLPRLPQVVLGAGFGPSLVVASVALAHILQARRRAPSIELAAICDSLAGGERTSAIRVIAQRGRLRSLTCRPAPRPESTLA